MNPLPVDSLETDILILGAGGAGMLAAVHALEAGPRLKIAKMNVDDNPGVAQRFGVTSIPTLMMFKDGKLVDRMVGAMPKGELQKFIDRNL